MNFMPVFAAAETFAYGTWGEKFALCGRMILTGLGTVFLVLVILWGVIAVFGAVAKMSERREQQRIMEEVRNSPAPNDMKKPAPPAPAEEPEAVSGEDDGVLIAVIHRFDDVEEKWVVAPEGSHFSREEIERLTAFQEQYFPRGTSTLSSG